MHVHAHHQHAHFCHVFSWLTTAGKRFANMSSGGRLDWEMWREGHDHDVGRAGTWRILEAETGLVDIGKLFLVLRLWEPCTYVVNSLACRDVKHKKQSCRSSRTSVTPTRVCLCGFSTMFPPLYKGKGDSFVSLFSPFLPFYIPGSACIRCTCLEKLCVCHTIVRPSAAVCSSVPHLNNTKDTPPTHLTSAAGFRSFFSSAKFCIWVFSVEAPVQVDGGVHVL